MRTIGHEEGTADVGPKGTLPLVMALGDWAVENIKRFLSGEKVAGRVRREDYL
jgi:hypothetical protein